MKIRDRWEKTTIANQLLVVVGAAACVFTALYTIAFFFQIWLVNQGNGQAADRTDRLLGNLNWLARTMEGSLRETERARRDSEKQSRDALDASIEVSRNDQRAWLGPIEVLPGDFVTGDKRTFLVEGHAGAKFGVLITNTGKTPALKVGYAINRKFLRATEKFVPTYEQSGERQIPSVSVIQPSMRMALVTLPMNRGLTNAEMSELLTAHEILYVFGHIDYADIFKRRHSTHFCLKMSRDLTQMLTCSEYNDAN